MHSYCIPRGTEGHVWFVADPHFDHANIIRYCSRPFTSVEDMNTCILDNWNSMIQEDDLVFFLGDMAFGRNCRTPRWWLTQLKGCIVYIKGSHDNGIRETSQGLNALAVVRKAYIQVGGQTFLAIHTPEDTPTDWEEWVIHGHHHNYQPQVNRQSKNIGVSVELTDYKPVSLEQILEMVEGHG